MNASGGDTIVRLSGDGATRQILRILCIDDEPAIRLSIQVFFEDQGHVVLAVKDGSAGLKVLETQEFDGVLLDLAMPGMSGLDVLKRIRELRPNLPVVVVSGTGSIPDVINALRLGAWDFITKPIEDMAILLYALDRALERARLIRENQLHNERLETLVRERTRDLREEIAERLTVEKALRASLSEKEVLLREIHHRVKNNLQIVSSLLSLQAAKAGNELAGEFLDSQSRVRAMALVHEKLYASEDLCCISFPDYLRQLASFLLQAYTPTDTEVVPDIPLPGFLPAREFSHTVRPDHQRTFHQQPQACLSRPRHWANNPSCLAQGQHRQPDHRGRRRRTSAKLRHRQDGYPWPAAGEQPHPPAQRETQCFLGSRRSSLPSPLPGRSGPALGPPLLGNLAKL